MDTENFLAENHEILDFVQQALLGTYGVNYSDKQIREAFTIAIQTIDIFQDVITKLQRDKCSGQHEDI